MAVWTDIVLLGLLVDLLFIFGAARQCLHDRIADACVIDLDDGAKPPEEDEWNWPDEVGVAAAPACSTCGAAHERDAVFLQEVRARLV